MKDSFFSLVDEKFKENSDCPLYNSNQEHAQYIINKIFQKARKNITIYAGGNDFPLYTSKEISNTLKSKKLKLSIIVDTKKDAENFLQIFPRNPIKILNRDIEINLEGFVSDSEYKNAGHFLVADGRYARIEKSHSPNSKKIKSLAFTNHKNLAKLLTKLGEYLIAHKE